jgi:hypothetical protein
MLPNKLLERRKEKFQSKQGMTSRISSPASLIFPCSSPWSSVGNLGSTRVTVKINHNDGTLVGSLGNTGGALKINHYCFNLAHPFRE